RFASTAMISPSHCRFRSAGSLSSASFLIAAVEKKEKKSVGIERVRKPGLRVGPLLPGLINRDLQRTRDLLMPKAGELAQLDYLGGDGVLLGELRERLVQGNEPVVGHVRGRRRIDQVHAL